MKKPFKMPFNTIKDTILIYCSSQINFRTADLLIIGFGIREQGDDFFGKINKRTPTFIRKTRVVTARQKYREKQAVFFISKTSSFQKQKLLTAPDKSYKA